MASTTFDPRTQESKSTEHFEKAKEAGMEAMNKGKEAGREAMSGMREAGTDVMGKARQAAVAAQEAATEAVSAVGHKADDVTAAAGHKIREFGADMGQKSPREGLTGAASQAFADTIEGGGRYIEEAKLSGMAQDVESLIKSHPLPALLICFGLGFCLGRVFKD